MNSSSSSSVRMENSLITSWMWHGKETGLRLSRQLRPLPRNSLHCFPGGQRSAAEPALGWGRSVRN